MTATVLSIVRRRAGVIVLATIFVLLAPAGGHLLACLPILWQVYHADLVALFCLVAQRKTEPAGPADRPLPAVEIHAANGAYARIEPGTRLTRQERKMFKYAARQPPAQPPRGP